MGEVTRPGCNSRCGGKLGEYRYRIERMGRRLLVTLQGFRHFCFKRSLPLPVFFFSTCHSLPFKIFTFWPCCEKCGTQFSDQRSNPCPLHWLCGLNTGLEVPLPAPSVFHRWLPSYWRNVLGKRPRGKGKMNSQTPGMGVGTVNCHWGAYNRSAAKRISCKRS